uniref:AbrB/MazE/SpoVT family DNA-binding domain-containing protein n=1 Tax=Flavobacterium myungsuense TaxID=651823 RepID=UPI0036D4326E
MWIYHSKSSDDKKNQRYVSTKGSITIPAEFRRLLGITEPTPLSLYVDIEKEAFILKKTRLRYSEVAMPNFYLR